MTEQDQQTSDIFLTEMVRTFWKRKVLILGGTALATVLAAVVSLVLPKVYRSGGFFQLSGITQKISVPEYKKSSSLFTSPIRFSVFVREKGYFQGKALEYLTEKYDEPDVLSKAISPIFSYSKEDIRETGQGSPEVNYVLGTSISAENDSADKARQTVYALGMLLRDCILYGKLDNFITYKNSNSMTELRRIENKIIETNFALDIQKKKKEELNRIWKQYPDAGKFGTREIIPPGNEGYRYLSPVTQLVGVESTITDLRGALIVYQRDKEKTSLEFTISKNAKGIMEQNHSGEKAFQGILDFAERFFKTQDLTRTSVQEVVNNFYIEMETYRKLFYEDMRFLSDPPLPAKVVAPKKRLISVVTFFLAFLLFLFVALITEWWHRNKRMIVSVRSSSV